VFARWLLNIFPTEVRHSWRLVQRDLALWVALAALLSVAIVGMPQPEQGPNIATFVTLVAAILTTSLPPLLFRAAALDLTLQWPNVLSTIAIRFLPLTIYSVVAIILAQGLASVVRIGTLTLTQGTPFGVPLSVGLATVVLATLFLQFLFMPFFVLLYQREDIPEELWQIGPEWAAPLTKWLWPLVASARLGDGIRWKVLPYLVISRVAPLAALLVPATLLLAAMVVSQLVSLWAMAVIFDYFRLRGAIHGFVDASDDWPTIGFARKS
jgi:hypothetical protein